MSATSNKIQRRPFMKELLAQRGRTLIVPGLGSPTWDCFAAGDSPEYLYSWGGMGLALPTALGIAQYIQDLVAAHPARPSVSITLIMISAAWMPFDRVTIVDEPRNHSQGELVVPLGAAVSAWQGRGFTTQYDVGIEANPNFRVLEAAFYYNYMALPLGWQMSQLSRDYLNLFRGEPEKCDESKIDRSLSSHAALANSYIERAHCVAARIVKDLTPTAPPAPADQKPITPVQ